MKLHLINLLVLVLVSSALKSQSDSTLKKNELAFNMSPVVSQMGSGGLTESLFELRYNRKITDRWFARVSSSFGIKDLVYDDPFSPNQRITKLNDSTLYIETSVKFKGIAQGAVGAEIRYGQNQKYYGVFGLDLYYRYEETVKEVQGTNYTLDGQLFTTNTDIMPLYQESFLSSITNEIGLRPTVGIVYVFHPRFSLRADIMATLGTSQYTKKDIYSGEKITTNMINLNMENPFGNILLQFHF